MTLGSHATVYVRPFVSVLHRLLARRNVSCSPRKPATVSKALSGADLSRARFSRSSKTFDREHRWNNVGFERYGMSEEKWGREYLALDTRVRKRDIDLHERQIVQVLQQ